MYVVIMAGGGGTRLHPLSRPERPKPFLPLLGPESLLQRTVDRLLAGEELPVTPNDITVITDRRFERILRDQLPDVHVLLEPMGRNTAAAIALATVVIDRPDDEVMAVLPADHTIEDETGFRSVLRKAETLAHGACGIDEPLVTLGVQVDRPATEYGYLIPDIDRGELVDGLQAYPLKRFQEKPDLARAELLIKDPGVAWNAGIFLWRRSVIRRALDRYTGLLRTLGPMAGSPPMLERAYESIQRAVSIDYAVMEGAALDHEVVMGAMDVGWSDLGSWSALLSAIGARGEGAVVQAGETTKVDRDDLIVRRVDGRLGVIAPAEPGSMTAAQPIAVLRGAAPDVDRIRAMIDRCVAAGV